MKRASTTDCAQFCRCCPKLDWVPAMCTCIFFRTLRVYGVVFNLMCWPVSLLLYIYFTFFFQNSFQRVLQESRKTTTGHNNSRFFCYRALHCSLQRYVLYFISVYNSAFKMATKVHKSDNRIMLPTQPNLTWPRHGHSSKMQKSHVCMAVMCELDI